VQAFCAEITRILGEQSRPALDSLAEKGFLSIESDPETKEKPDAALFHYAKVLLVNFHRLEEFALVEEFEGPPVDMQTFENMEATLASNDAAGKTSL